MAHTTLTQNTKNKRPLRNSTTHPLTIDSFPLAAGRVGMTLCPGRKGRSTLGTDWDRDLASDVARLKAWKAAIIVSLTEDAEMRELRVGDLPGALGAAGITWLHLPIPDTEAPGPGWAEAWRMASPQLHRALKDGRRIVIHCKAGLERSAIIAALLQCEQGDSLETALAVIAATRPGAGPLPHQRRWLEAHLDTGDRQRHLFRASLIGGAIGDALGAEIEFWPLGRILAHFPNGVDGLLEGQHAAFTDDTQMTLFTAEGLIRACVRWHARGICHAPSVVHHALLRWLETQGEAGRTSPLDRIGLIEDPRLHHRRAPGLTCLSALCDSRRFGDPARNDSKGCGAIMRVAPIGLMCRPDRIDEMADECSHLTHGHRTGRDSARAFAHLLSLVLHGASLARALDRVQAMDLDHATLAAIRAARMAPPDGRPETVETLGGGWVAEEALAIALYAARVGTGFRHGLRIALTHSGDSDSTAAIAGNLLGLIYPEEALTHPLCTQIEGADLIERIACDLHACTQPGEDFAERMRDRYPGC